MGIANIINNSTTTSGGEIVRELVNSSDGAGLQFDGSAGYIDIASPPDLGTKFSFEFVIKADSTGSSSKIVDLGDGGRFVIEQNTTGLQVKPSNSGGWVTLQSPSPLADLAVHHLVLTVDGTTATLFDNGNQTATATISATDIDSCADAKIGSYFDSATDLFNGTIYRARFYNKTLTSAEVQTAYERADVDFADQYGVLKILNGRNWTGASGATPPNSWSVGTAGTFTIDSSSGSGSEPALKITNSGAANPYISQVITSAEIGKLYRIKYRVKNVDATHVRVAIGSSSLGGQYDDRNTTATSWSDVETTFTATTTTISALIQLQSTSGEIGYIDSLVVEQVGCVSDYDLAFANPTQSLMVQDRSGAADGTCSASGVTQVQPIIQGNMRSLAVTTSQQAALVPADGEVVATGVKAETYRSSRADGDVYIQAATASDFVAIGTQVSMNLLKIDGSGNVTVEGGDLKIKAPSGNQTDAELLFSSPNSSAYGSTFAIDSKILSTANQSDNPYGSKLKFYTSNNSDVVTERLSIDSSGNAIIGTGTAGRLLELSNATNPALRLNNGNSVADIGIASSAGALLTGAADDDLVIARNGAYGIAIGTNGTTRLAINSAGQSSFVGHAVPATNYGHDLGTASLQWSNVYAFTGNFSGGINLGNENLTKYQEGSFTPTIGAETGTINGTNIVGRYTRIGNVCHVWFSIECTGVSGASGAVEFGNFPFTSSSIASGYNTPMVVRYVSLGSAVESLVLRLFNGSSGGRIEEQNGTSVTNLADNVQNGTIFQVAGSYRV